MYISCRIEYLSDCNLTLVIISKHKSVYIIQRCNKFYFHLACLVPLSTNNTKTMYAYKKKHVDLHDDMILDTSPSL